MFFVLAANLLFSSTMSGVPQSALQGPWEVAERATPSLVTWESVSAELVHRVDLQSIFKGDGISQNTSLKFAAYIKMNISTPNYHDVLYHKQRCRQVDHLEDVPKSFFPQPFCKRTLARLLPVFLSMLRAIHCRLLQQVLQ